MYEEELLEKIRKSSEEIKIPEELTPGEIEKKLKSVSKSPRKWIGALGSAAAAVVLFCSIGAVYQINQTKSTSDAEYDTTGADLGNAESGESLFVTEEGERIAVAKGETSKSDAGDLYRVAEDYTQVYKALTPPVYSEKEAEEKGFLQKITDSLFDTKSSGTRSDGAVEDIVEESVADMAEGSTNESAAAADTGAALKDISYSKTNVQTKGVDESDIIKTDGSYIYTVLGSQITITDIRDKEMKTIGYLDLGDSSADIHVVEMYVSKDEINLVVQKEETMLSQGEIQMRPADPKYSSNSEKDTFQVDSKSVTELLTYDISDRENPKLKGTVTQDGSYKNSRKIGDVVYLFTESFMEQPEVKNNQVVTDEEAGRFIPLVNGNMIDADCIYLPDYGSMGCVVSSVNTENPGEVLDEVLIINNYAEIYVSQDAIYLYHSDYERTKTITRVAKFSLKKGEINAVGAASVSGEVYDTFAVAEEKGNLRVLTTDTSGSTDSNNLYLLDEKLKLTGKLEGIAKGEQVYSARFLGDTAYFVTYRNTDPLFAVDLSDPKNPKILSEVKLSGFSEYLHFWGKDKLVGIGYETDEETGIREGLKLVLFDIKDPADVKIQKEFVIENGDYSPALYQYKTVLADPEENLLGFAMTSYENGEKTNYLLFSVEKGNFKNLLTADLEDSSTIEEYRGIYAGDRFYLASPTNITSFDRTKNYRKIQKLEL